MKVTRCQFVHGLPCEQVAERISRLESENAKLRELLREMWVDVPKSDECKFDMSMGHCVGYVNCKGECQYWYRMRDLGVEVDG